MGRPRIEIPEARLIEARHSDRPAESWAEELGVSVRLLHRRWAEMGLTDPHTPSTEQKPVSKRRRISDPADRYPQIVALHAEGLSAEQSAERLGVGRATIFRAWKVLGLSSPQYAHRNLIIRRMAEAEMPAMDIARTLGLHPTTVRDHLRTMGLKAGTPKRWGRGDEVETLARRGMRAPEIARRLGISYNSAWYHMDRRGPLRKRA